MNKSLSPWRDSDMHFEIEDEPNTEIVHLNEFWNLEDPRQGLVKEIVQNLNAK